MDKKQTAVEWFKEMLIDNKYLSKDAEHLFEEAKSMEKEQIIDAYFSAIKITGEGWNGEYAQGNSPNIKDKFQEEFEQYYTSTYGE